MSVVKNLTIAKRISDGRNNTGRTTVYHRGGGFVSRHRVIDFGRYFKNIRARVVRFEQTMQRTASLALLFFDNGFLAYTLSVEKLRLGDFITYGSSSLLFPGNALPLKTIPLGFHINSIDFRPAKKTNKNVNINLFGAKISRAAGASAQLLKREGNYTLIRLSSNELRWIHSNCFATLGVISPMQHRFEKLYKAGQSRWLGRKPVVRGTAKNPVDHPHGGGQGKTSGGRCSVTPWAKLTKGKKTRPVRKVNKFIYKFR